MTRERVVLLGLLLIAVHLAFRAWAVYGAWFHFDDFAFLSKAYNNNLDWDYLMESYGGHLMPAGFTLTWLYAKYEPMGFWPYATTLLVLQAVASVGFLRLLVHLFGRRPAVLLLLAIYLFSVISLPAFIWWAAGINQLPLLISLFYGLHSHISYLRTRKLRHVYVTLAWSVFGLLFYEKTLLVFVVYGFFALAYFTTGKLEERVGQLWQKYRPGVLLHGLVATAYLAVYIATALNFDPNNANEVPVFPVAYRFIFEAFSSGILGGPWQWTDIDPVGTVANPSDVVVFASWLLLGYIGFYAYRSRVRTLRAWLLTGVLLVLNVLLLTMGRAFLAGPDIGLEYRYQTEMAPIFALSLGLAFLPLLSAPETVELRPGTADPVGIGRPLTVGTLVFTAAALVSNFQFVHHWQSRNQAISYFDNVRADLSEQGSGSPVPLADVPVPQYIMWGFRYPENTYSKVFKLYDDKTRYPSAATDRLLVFDNRGRLRPALITSARRNVPHEDEICGYRVEDEGISIPLDDPVMGGGWWVRMGYLADGDADLTVTAGRWVHDVEVKKGLHSLFFRAGGDFDRIRLSGLDNGVSLCTNDITLGVPEPFKPQ